jgi:hypothetical protein
MLTSLKRHSVRSCFVSAPAGMDLGVLPESLSRRGISWEWAKAAIVEVANTYAAIREADVFIGVLNGTRADYRVVHETGVAVALEKPILLIMSARTKLPVDLSHFSVAHVKLNDDRALGFHLDAFLAAPRRNVFEHRASTPLAVPEPPSVLAPTYAHSDTPQSSLEREIFELIQRTGGSAIAEPRTDPSGRYRPDLLFWLGSQEPELLDPAVIEVKGSVRPGSIRAIEEELLGFMNRTGVRTGLVITAEPVPKRTQPIWPTIFWLDLPKFRELLESSRLGPYLRDLRNRAIHGVR